MTGHAVKAHVRRVSAALAAVGLVLGGCAGNGTGTTETTETAQPGAGWSQGAIPTAEQLAAALFSDEDLEGTWTVNVPPDAPEAAISGVVTEEMSALLPRMQLCDGASPESIEAVDALQWQAFRQLDMTPEDPLDMAAGDRSGHMIFAQEFLLSGDPAEIEATFTAWREGALACMGEQPVTEDGETILSEELAIPAIGEDRFGELDTVGEPGGGAIWSLNNAMVRDGPVLMWVDVAEIVMGEGVEPELSRAEIDQILTTAAEKVS